MNRSALLSIIPKITNQDVFVYDSSLLELSAMNVPREYSALIAKFTETKKDFLYKRELFKSYKDKINNSFLTEKNWTEDDYILALKNLEITYSKTFGEIKKIENNLKIAENNIEKINDKIRIQQKLDDKKVEDERNMYEQNLKKLKEEKTKIEFDIKVLENEIKYLEEELALYDEEFDSLYKTYKGIKDGTEKFYCDICGSRIRKTSKYFKILSKKVELNSKKSNKKKSFLSNKKKELKILQDDLNKKTREISRLKEIKTNTNLIYSKKSIEILQLETAKRDFIKKRNFFKKELQDNKKANSKQYIELKNKIEDYKQSLQTLAELKEINKNIVPLNDELNLLFEECRSMKEQLVLYVKFLKIYYKICEKKINEYFGPSFKFVFAEFDGIYMTEVLKVFYNDIEYSKLDDKLQKECDEEYNKKINNY